MWQNLVYKKEIDLRLSPLMIVIGRFQIDGWTEQRRISVPGWRTSYLTARTKNVVSHRVVEECRITQHGRKTLYLGAFTASTWPVYGEIWRSLSARRDVVPRSRQNGHVKFDWATIRRAKDALALLVYAKNPLTRPQKWVRIFSSYPGRSTTSHPGSKKRKWYFRPDYDEK